MTKLTLFFLSLIIGSITTYGANKLISVNSSFDQDILRLEFFFEKPIDSNKISFQYDDKNMSMNLPNVEFSKKKPEIISDVPFIESLNLEASAEQSVNLLLKFREIQSIQMKENVALESLGKTLIFELLPPVWNKSLSSKSDLVDVNDKKMASNKLNKTLSSEVNIEPSVQGTPIQNHESSPNSTNTQNTKVENAELKNTGLEKDTPLFSPKTSQTSSSNEGAKIILFLFVIAAIGGVGIWWLKNKSKMVNGPESLMKIKLITQFHLAPKKSLAVVRVAGESLLLSVTESHINLIKTLSLLDEDITEPANENFSKTLSKSTQRIKTEPTDEENENNLGEDFEFGPAAEVSLSKKSNIFRKFI